MANLSIIRTALSSRVVRDSIGDRVLRLFEADPADGSLLNRVWDLALSFKSWILSNFKNVFSFSLTEIWGFVTSTIRFVWNFNFNATDQELDQQMNARINALYGVTGGVLGQLTGQLACGALPGGVIFYFNPTLGKTVLENVAEEIIDEFCGNVALLARMTARTAMMGYITQKFKNVRNAIKYAANNPAFDSIFRGFLGAKHEEIVSNWGKAGQEPWSFAIAFENLIESIPNQRLQNFVEEFMEEAIEGCVEIGYVVANSADSYFAQQRTMRSTVLGSPRVVEIVPDRSIPEERIVITGRDTLIRPAINTALVSHQLIENRDVGQIVGESLHDRARADPSALKLIIKFSSQPPGRPITSANADNRTATYRISDLNRAKCDWLTIKQAAGINGYLWGRFRCTAQLSNRRQMAVYGGTPQSAEERLKALATLTNAEVVSLSITEELTQGRRDTTQRMYKPTMTLYPTYCTIINSQLTLNQNEGRPTLTGNRITRRNRIALYPDSKPFDADERLQEMLFLPGPNFNYISDHPIQ